VRGSTSSSLDLATSLVVGRRRRRILVLPPFGPSPLLRHWPLASSLDMRAPNPTDFRIYYASINNLPNYTALEIVRVMESYSGMSY